MSLVLIKDEKQLKIIELAQDILNLSRNTLLVNLRFLDMALSQFEYVPEYTETLSTDGQHLFYNPLYVLKCYKDETERNVRDYLHMVMHCIFRHMYVSSNVNIELWNLACDIAVEYSIIALNIKSTTIKRESEEKYKIEILEQKLGPLTAEKLYAYFQQAQLSDYEIKSLQSLFYADDHEIWYQKSDASEVNYSLSSVNNEKTWEDISKRIQLDLETFSNDKSKGNEAGNLLFQLGIVNREKYDYSKFLKKFAVRGEMLQVNNEEFDYIMYTYGLKIYGTMPLMEPLEYKEIKRIREFVIVIDTSGSVIGDEVKSFVRKTYNILKDSESFFTKVNIHIIQCDAEVQEHVKITTQDEFDNYIEKIAIHGGGGTDFRPAFELINQMVSDREFTNLKGILYFTDGYGEYPTNKPDYETAFVFIEGDDEHEVPFWAIKIVLPKGELKYER